MRIAEGREVVGFVAVAHRGGIGHPGAELEHRALLRRVELHVATDFGAWSDEAHLAAQDVDELGELVELRRAEESADGGDSRVLADGDLGTDTIGIRPHRADLPHVEGLTSLANALVSEPRCVAVLQEYEDGNGNQER